MDDRYATDVLADGLARPRLPRRCPGSRHPRDLVVEVAADGFCGAVVGVAVRPRRARGPRRPPSPVPARPRIPRRRCRCRARAADRGRVARPRSGRHPALSPSPSPRARRAGEPHPRRGQARRRTRREGLGRRPARRGRRRRVPAGRRPARRRCSTPSRRGAAPLRRARRPPRAGFEGVPHRRGVARGPHGRHITIVGHPYVDVWQCVTPRRWGSSSGRTSRGGSTEGRASAVRSGWPSETPADLARAWQRILGRVTSYRDLEPALLGRVEELIDFVDGLTDGLSAVRRRSLAWRGVRARHLP